MPGTHVCYNRFAEFQSVSLRADGDFSISVGRVQTDVPQPSPDNIYLDTRLQQMDCKGMAEYVRSDSNLRRGFAEASQGFDLLNLN